MILGCGVSDIGARLYEEGYLYITNIDFSQTVVEYMREKHQNYEEMDCKIYRLFRLEERFITFFLSFIDA